MVFGASILILSGIVGAVFRDRLFSCTTSFQTELVDNGEHIALLHRLGVVALGVGDVSAIHRALVRQSATPAAQPRGESTPGTPPPNPLKVGQLAEELNAPRYRGTDCPLLYPLCKEVYSNGEITIKLPKSFRG